MENLTGNEISNGGKENDIKASILRVLAFFDIFDYPLTVFEIWKYLGTGCEYGKVLEVLKNDDLQLVVQEKNGFYFIAGREKILENRHKRQALSHRKYGIAMKAARVLRYINGVRMVAVCNNFSYRQDSDIDIFIVVQKNRMWLTRLFTTLVTQALRLRRHGNKIADRVCLSFYVSEDNMDLSTVSYKNDPYFDYWLAWLMPIYDCDNCYRDFWQKNYWLKHNLPNIFKVHTGDERTIRDNYFSGILKRVNAFWFDSYAGDTIERFCKKIQMAKMANNYSSVASADDTRVVISDKMLKFHEEDRREEYKKRMESTVNKLNKALLSGEEYEQTDDEPTVLSVNNFEHKTFLDKTIERGLYLLLFLLPWQTRLIFDPGFINGGYFEYGTKSIYATDVLVGLILSLAFYKVLTVKRSKERKDYLLSGKRYGTLLFLLAGFDLMVFVSIFFSDSWSLSTFVYLRFLLGIGLFWLLTNTVFNKLKLYTSFFAGVFIQSLLAIWQFLSQSTFANKWLGMAFHSAGEGMAGVVEVTGAGRWLRSYGALDHPNVLGGFLTIAFLLSVWVNVAKRYKLQSIFGFVALNYIFVPVVSAALFFTFSRSAWLGLVVGLVVFLSVAVIKKDLLAQKKILRIILVSGITVFILLAGYGDLVSTRFANETRLEIKSTNERMQSLYLASEIIRVSPSFGVGVGNYTNFVHKHVSKYMPSYAYQPVHNVYLLVATEVGFWGSLFFVSIFVYLLMCIFRQCLGVGSSCYNLSLVMALLVMMMFDHWWWSLHFGIFFFWIIIGIVYTEVEWEIEKNQ